MGRYRARLFGFLLAALAAGPAAADSDGYYCAGPGYLAYQFNGISVEEPGHRLRIVSVGGGIAPPVEVRLDPFQVHGMRCTERSVELLGWDRVFICDLTEQRTAQGTRETKVEPGSRFPGFESRNLGDWSRAGTELIGADDSDFTYELVIRKEEQQTVEDGYGLVLHRTTSDLVQRDQHGKEVNRFRIYEGVFEETVD